MTLSPRKELEESSASLAARTLNAYFWLMVTQKVKYSGALEVLEGGFSQAWEKMVAGLQKHYGLPAEAVRFFSGHIEADREHAQTGRKLVELLLTTDDHRAGPARISQRGTLRRRAVLEGLGCNAVTG